MFDIGFLELVLLAGLGLIVLGPKRLPEVAAQVGRWVGQARRMSRTLMYQLRQEVNLDDPKPFASGRSTTAGKAETNTMHGDSAADKSEPKAGETEKSETQAGEKGKDSE